ncbi:Membrane-bound metallopeptidase [Slackia heliotrinireducens]|uniref:Membrane-bound metallopeptidase n=1 Tax=Slackia heliotrinireducens (strain ATCC 29202 / DSM 20476 / NCTC 11029 / RHS 1) TaxID=471855 RepID=C7N3Z3_SLAHD|nr:RlpA-like double-psi beta-barrel domain-containing protein [Slackia heliotrinireducens]ACV21734.1 hypothetical protein Shel_06750 [Slackia heliotrinireducens DSM 20476]VEG99381.1 Membrane-bound metallopeptidase [Slackia heliotrinireducens]
MLGAFGAATAYADTVSAAQSDLDAAEERLAEITEEYEAIQAEVDDLQAQIDEATVGVMEAQEAVRLGKENLAHDAIYSYKGGGVSLLGIVLGSQNLDDLVKNISYLDAIEGAQMDAIEEQQRLNDEFQAALDDLGSKKDLQMEKLSEAADKAAEAQQVVTTAERNLQSAQAEAAEAERLAELQAQAEALAAQQAEKAAQKNAVVEEGVEEEPSNATEATESKQESSSDDASSADESDADESSQNTESDSTGGGSTTPETVSDNTTGWHTGTASAYGAVSDGTLGATTALGNVVTESSMGVAIPMSMPNYTSYMGRSVEISYNGRTVVAYVDDCGGLYGRSLDLQPGVWAALGASSCFDWGVRTVSYRFL